MFHVNLPCCSRPTAYYSLEITTYTILFSLSLVLNAGSLEFIGIVTLSASAPPCPMDKEPVGATTSGAVGLIPRRVLAVAF